jgi:hypothetical protein
MKRSSLPHTLNLAFIAAAILTMFWRVFLLGETFVDVATLNNQLPWGHYAGQSNYPYNRRDLTDTYVTRDYFVVRAYSRGELPLWNPYVMAGHPIYADGVTKIFSPALLFYTFLDVPLGYSVARVAELLFAAIFTYAFLTGIGLRPEAGLVGSLALAFSSHSMFHLTGLGWMGGLMWFPLILLFADRAIRRNSLAQAALAGVFLAMQFFCGYIPNQIYYVGAVALYYFFFLGPKRFVAPCAITLAVGLALSATQWVPVVELLGHSNRYIVPTQIGYVYLPPWYLATLIFPNLFGQSYDARAMRLFMPLGVSHDHILYFGAVAFVMALLGVYWSWRGRDESGRRTLFFVLLAALALFAMMAAPLYVHVTKYIPVLRTIRVVVRAGVVFVLAASALAAIGADLLLSLRLNFLVRFYVLARGLFRSVAASALVAVAASYAIRHYGVLDQASADRKVEFIRKAALFLSEQFAPPGAGILVPLGMLAATCALIRLLVMEKLSRRSSFYAIFFLLIADLFWNGLHYNPTFDRSRIFPRTQMTDLVKSLPPGRVLVAPSDLDTNRRLDELPGGEKIIAPPNTLLPYEIAAVTGKDQLFPRWYREFCSLVEPQPELSHVVFDRLSSRYFDMLNVRYVLTRPGLEVPRDYKLLATAEGLHLYENPSAMPRVFLVRGAIIAPGEADALRILSDPNFNPRESAVVTAPAPGIEASESGSARITGEKLNSISIEVEGRSSALLVLSDNYYPGWRAQIDGEPVEILRANHTMRAVMVPAGRHIVSFVFSPASFIWSSWASLAAAAVLIAVMLGGRLRRSG